MNYQLPGFGMLTYNWGKGRGLKIKPEEDLVFQQKINKYIKCTIRIPENCQVSQVRNGAKKKKKNPFHPNFQVPQVRNGTKKKRKKPHSIQEHKTYPKMQENKVQGSRPHEALEKKKNIT